jgi:hypothetical protein
MLKDDRGNKILIGSFLEASCKEAFEIDDIRQVETAIDRSQTNSDENNDDDHRFIAKPKGKNKENIRWFVNALIN